MTEHNDLLTLRADAPLPDGRQLARQRAALLASFDEREAPRPAVASSWMPRRRLITVAATVGALAVAGGVLVSLPDGSATSATAQAPGTAGGRLLSAQASADTLELAAATVEKYGTPEPKPSQWVYEKSSTSQPRVALETSHGSGNVQSSRPVKPWEPTESWTRWDGTGFASQVPGGKLGVSYGPDQEDKEKKEGYDDRSQRQMYDFLATLPSDPDKLMAGIRKEHAIDAVPGETLAQRDWREIDVLYRSVLVPPNAQAGLFRALARIPGARVEKGVKDPAGRPAIGVTVNYPEAIASGRKGKQEIWFDATTYAYLGEVTRVAPPKGAASKTPTALTEVRNAYGVVDKPGQRP